MQIDTWDRDIRAAIYATWERLPLDVRRHLDGVRFTSGQHARKSWASAGATDVDIRRLPMTTDASVGIIVHELGHVAGCHYVRLNSGEITEQEAEREADAYARHWGFGRELDARRNLLGR